MSPICAVYIQSSNEKSQRETI